MGGSIYTTDDRRTTTPEQRELVRQLKKPKASKPIYDYDDDAPLTIEEARSLIRKLTS